MQDFFYKLTMAINKNDFWHHKIHPLCLLQNHYTSRHNTQHLTITFTVLWLSSSIMAIDLSEINGEEVRRLISLKCLHFHQNIRTLLVSGAYTWVMDMNKPLTPFKHFFCVIRSALQKMKCVFNRLALERPKPMSRHQKMTWVFLPINFFVCVCVCGHFCIECLF